MSSKRQLNSDDWDGDTIPQAKRNKQSAATTAATTTTASRDEEYYVPYRPRDFNTEQGYDAFVCL